MIIIIAYIIISSPILAIFFFIIYKSYLGLKNLLTKNKLNPELISKYSTQDSKANNTALQADNKDEDEEITAVISAAVSFYYANQ
ncbi:MAG: hypothetical protein RBS16_06515 [Candidatus Cloacimonadales bacterium]|jgi:lipid A disaccharide synthetase|nr:hypothetical protein [Candidatus Cloacimonadales bacterium]